ncbi:MAG TPA: hypothetical protein VN799_09470 [Acidimicrobiales bacterium]|nr:hypothetical protein [Acidimicrobiales bacterium]
MAIASLPPLRPLPPSFATTREALHLVAARVLGAARYAAVGRLGLVVVPGGFGTPEFDGRRLLVVDGILSDGTRRQPITTLARAYAFAGLDPDTPTHPVLDLPADPTAVLAVDIDAARVLADWFAFCQSHLEARRAVAQHDDDPSPIQLWPEHFDLALENGKPGSRANYGGSPGDTAIDEPYLYVGPHDRRDGSFWNTTFGAALTYDDIRAGADPADFFVQGHELLQDH